MAADGGMAATDPLCAEQFKNADLAALKVVPEAGYGFNGWIVDGAHMQMTSAEPLFLSTRPVLADNGAEVQVKNGCTETQADCQKQTVYLTFDDGPLAGTDDVIRILNEENVVGSFFMVGVHASGSQREGWVRDANELFEIGNHSYSHPWKQSDLQSYYAETDEAAQHVLDDFQKNDATLSNIVGVSIQWTLSRLPTKNTWRIPAKTSTDDSGGKYPPGKKVADVLHKHGYQIYGWDSAALWEDKKVSDICNAPIQSPQDMAKIVQNVFQKGGVKPNNVVILMHDRMFRNSCKTDVKLQEFIQILKNPPYGYAFEYLSKY